MMSAAERLLAGERAAKHRFPDETSIVDRLLTTDENFRDMCEELAEVEAALESIDRVSVEAREETRVELLELVDRLTLELRESLGSANVVSITDRVSTSSRTFRQRSR